MSDNKTSCSKCESCDSMYWEKDEENNILCENCNEDLIARNLAKEIMQHEMKRGQSEQGDTESEEDDDDDDDDIDDYGDDRGPIVRRSLRNILNKYKNPDLEPAEPRERNRRALAFRRENVYKSPSAQATCVTSDFVFFKGIYYQKGDIVAVVDSEGRGIFYAQITSFLTDQYCNKSATIQWLLPTRESPDPNIAFDPRTYYLGYVEDIPRALESMVPIMHAPSDYYKFNNTPYPPTSPHPTIHNYISCSMRRVYIYRPDE